MLTSRGARSSPRRGGVAGSRHRLNRTMYSRDPPSLARAPELGSRAADEGSLSWRYPIARRGWLLRVGHSTVLGTSMIAAVSIRLAGMTRTSSQHWHATCPRPRRRGCYA
eukprot:1091424-Rhodomonas_salina.2